MDENEMQASAMVQEQDSQEEDKQKIFEALLEKELEDQQEEYDFHPKHAI